MTEGSERRVGGSAGEEPSESPDAHCTAMPHCRALVASRSSRSVCVYARLSLSPRLHSCPCASLTDRSAGEWRRVSESQRRVAVALLFHSHSQPATVTGGGDESVERREREREERHSEQRRTTNITHATSRQRTMRRRVSVASRRRSRHRCEPSDASPLDCRPSLSAGDESPCPSNHRTLRVGSDTVDERATG